MGRPATVLGEAGKDLFAALIADLSFGTAELVGDHLAADAIQDDRHVGVRAEVAALTTRSLAPVSFVGAG
jgi:hypothetical protein